MRYDLRGPSRKCDSRVIIPGLRRGIKALVPTLLILAIARAYHGIVGPAL